MNIMGVRSCLAAVLCIAVGVVLCLPAVALEQPREKQSEGARQSAASFDIPKTAAEAKALVRRIIERQMTEDEKHGHSFMWVQKENGKRGVLTKEMVDTQEGIVARLIAINDRPLTPAERQADDARLSRLLSDPQNRAQKLRQQQEDEKRTRNMVHALPDAFLYEPDGTMPGANGAELVRLRFKPDPSFDPPSRELQVYQGMEGFMLLDTRAQRLAEINARLFRDVNFGWGILGHLDKGGEFMVRQADVTGKHDWEVVAMKLKFDGKVLIFKPLHIRDDESASNFRVVPEGMTFAQGVDLLRKQDSAVAEKK